MLVNLYGKGRVPGLPKLYGNQKNLEVDDKFLRTIVQYPSWNCYNAETGIAITKNNISKTINGGGSEVSSTLYWEVLSGDTTEEDGTSTGQTDKASQDDEKKKEQDSESAQGVESEPQKTV